MTHSGSRRAHYSPRRHEVTERRQAEPVQEDTRPCPACGAALGPADTHWSLYPSPMSGYVCPETGPLTFRQVAETNAARCDRWHHGFPGSGDGWTGADWSNAMQGEAGEAGNVVKKLRRMDFGLWGNRKPGDGDRPALVASLADEIADTFIYLDLLATFYGVDLASAVVSKFNRISEEAGFPERLPVAS